MSVDPQERAIRNTQYSFLALIAVAAIGGIIILFLLTDEVRDGGVRLLAGFGWLLMMIGIALHTWEFAEAQVQAKTPEENGISTASKAVGVAISALTTGSAGRGLTVAGFLLIIFAAAGAGWIDTPHINMEIGAPAEATPVTVP